MASKTLKRIAEALERMAPAPQSAPDFDAAEAFVWHTGPDPYPKCPVWIYRC